MIASGAWTSIKMGVPGEENPNVLGGIDFLRKAALGELVMIGDAVVIVGGGNTAMDACERCAPGSQESLLYLPKDRSEMPAEDIEIKEAKRRGRGV